MKPNKVKHNKDFGAVGLGALNDALENFAEELGINLRGFDWNVYEAVLKEWERSRRRHLGVQTLTGLRKKTQLTMTL